MAAVTSPRGRRYGGQAVLGAIDQAALAAAHFVLGVVVAREGGIVALGGFAFAYSLIVLVNMLHAAVIAEIFSIEPNVSDGIQRYGTLPIVLVTMILGLLSVLGIGIASFFSDEIRSGAWIPSFLCALMLSAYYWSVKPFFYRQGRAIAVLMTTAVYAVVMLVSAWMGYRWQGTNWQPLWSIAAGAAAASVPLWQAMKRPDTACMVHVQQYLHATMKYAGWALPAAVLIWINSNGYMFVMPLYGDAAQTGGLRAVLNLVAPINTVLVGACTAWLPKLAELHRSGDARVYARTVHGVAASMLVITLLGGLLIAPFSAELIGLIYGKAYTGFADVLRVAALLPALWVVASIYRAAIRAQANTRDLFKVYAFALVPVGLALMLVLSRMGAAAAVKGMLITQLLVVIGFLYYFTRQTRQRQVSV